MNQIYQQKYEKRKISLDQQSYDSLLKDARAFGFVKNDGTVNKSRFMNVLIGNYYEAYVDNQDATHDYLFKTIKSMIEYEGADVADYMIEKTVYDIMDKQITSALNIRKKDHGNVNIIFRPDHNTADIIEKIQYILASNIGGRYNAASISGYFRTMIHSYLQKPRNQREQIICKDIYEKILSDVDHEKCITIVDANHYHYRHEKPWGIVSSPEELFNYVLVMGEDHNPHSIRLSRIASIIEEPVGHARKFTDEENAMFERIAHKGPQFPFSEMQEIKVKLTDQGLIDYQRIYMNRPDYDKCEGHVMTFACSEQQVFLYFKRFGKEAIVLQPKELQEKLLKYYSEAKEVYENE